MTRRLALAALVVVAVVDPAAAQDVPRFRVNVDAVQVDVSVMRGGRPVTGLTSDNFEVRDSGVLQPITVVAMEDVPIHLFLALDTSVSVMGRLLAELKDATQAAIAALRSQDRVTILAFSHDLRLLADATGDRDSASRTVASVGSHDWTSLHDAIFHAFVLRREESRRALLVVFSDGDDTTSWLGADTILEDARRTDVSVYGVARTTWWAPGSPRLSRRAESDMHAHQNTWFASEPQLFRGALLRQLTEQTGGSLYDPGGWRDLRTVFLDIVREFRSRYVLSYSPEGVPAGGWHPIEVKLKGAKGDVTARRGYQR